MARLGIVLVSTRARRVGDIVAAWFLERARQHGAFDIDFIDLRAVALPMFDEPVHPRLRNYQHEHTKAWSARVAPLDAFVFVTPEYNFGMAPALVNALDYLYVEWNYKPCAFVSYGGVSGGLRAVQMAKQIVAALKMVPIVEAVAIPFVSKVVEGGTFAAAEAHEKAATLVLDELFRWHGALRVLR